jgi:hypothetical protein
VPSVAEHIAAGERVFAAFNATEALRHYAAAIAAEPNNAVIVPPCHATRLASVVGQEHDEGHDAQGGADTVQTVPPRQ